MDITIFKKPKLKNPIMLAAWGGIGSIGIAVVSVLKEILKAEELGKIESLDFFNPRKVLIKDGLLVNLEFPSNKFYYQNIGKGDLIIFIGEEQPIEGGGKDSRGEKAHQLAQLVVNLGLKFGCGRIFTSGAYVSPTHHHQMEPRVIAAVSSQHLIKEVKHYPNTVLMSEAGESRGSITGLNGLLLGVARKRNLEGICLMGEIPDWLSGVPLPYPKASKSVLKVFSEILGIKIGFGYLDEIESQVEEFIETYYKNLPQEVREKYDNRKILSRQIKPETVTLRAQILIDGRFKEGCRNSGEKKPS